MKAGTRKTLTRSWGYLLLVLILYGWFAGDFSAAALAALSVLSLLFFLFQAPVWCLAETRNNDYCRNNASGILLGCHFRQHRWQKLKMVSRRSSWGQLAGRLAGGFAGQTAVISALASVASVAVALAALLAGPSV